MHGHFRPDKCFLRKDLKKRRKNSESALFGGFLLVTAPRTAIVQLGFCAFSTKSLTENALGSIDRPVRDVPLPELAVAALLGGAMALILRHTVARWFRRATAITRATRARNGERRAEELLREHGYRIEDRQHTHSYVVRCGDEPHTIELRADLLVMRHGRRYLAEVKTGAEAPSIESANTRRQLLEYRIAFDVDGVLLVDMENASVAEVVFPIPTEARTKATTNRRATLALLTAVALMIAVIVAQYVRTHSAPW